MVMFEFGEKQVWIVYVFYLFISISRQCLIMFITIVKTFNNGSLGSRIDEERSEMR